MSRSIFPCAARSRMSLVCLGVRNRLSTSTVTGKERKRFMAVAQCCWASTVVGTRMAACLPSRMHFITARRGHLRLAVAHIAAQQPVHGYGLFHIRLDLPDGL